MGASRQGPQGSEGMKGGMGERLSEEGPKEGETSNFEGVQARGPVVLDGCLVVGSKGKDGNIIQFSRLYFYLHPTARQGPAVSL